MLTSNCAAPEAAPSLLDNQKVIVCKWALKHGNWHYDHDQQVFRRHGEPRSVLEVGVASEGITHCIDAGESRYTTTSDSEACHEGCVKEYHSQ